MLKSALKNKKISRLVILGIFSLLAIAGGGVWAISVWNEGYRVNHSGGIADVTIGSAGGLCKRVTNNNTTNDYFVPTKTQAEWNAFSAYPPSGITISACNLITLSGTTHTYTSTSVNTAAETVGAGVLSIDGDLNTAMQEGNPSTDMGIGGGESTRTVVSQHTWSVPRNVPTITYKMRTYTYQTGVNNNHDIYNQKIEYTTDGTNWIELSALTVSGSYGANTGVHDVTTSYSNVAVNLTGVVGIRVTCTATASTNDGHKYAAAYIYEIQAWSG